MDRFARSLSFSLLIYRSFSSIMFQRSPFVLDFCRESPSKLLFSLFEGRTLSGDVDFSSV